MFIANGWRKRIKLRRSGMSGLLFGFHATPTELWEIIFGNRGYNMALLRSLVLPVRVSVQLLISFRGIARSRGPRGNTWQVIRSNSDPKSGQYGLIIGPVLLRFFTHGWQQAIREHYL